MNTQQIFYIVCGVVAVIMIIYYIRRKRRLLSAFFGVFSGIAALFAVNYFGGAMGVDLPLNLFNLCGSAILGIPFVALLIIINIL